MASTESPDLSTAAAPAVFLSYSREDRRQAEAIIRALETGGHRVWWDGLLTGGVAFGNTTEHALETAASVVVLWSRVSIDSHWVRDEATRGRDRGCLVPVSLDGSMPPLGFRQYQVIDLSRWRGKADAPELQALLQAVGKVQGSAASVRGPAPTLSQAPAMLPRRKLLLGGGGLLAAALAGGGIWYARPRAGSAPKSAPAIGNSVAVLPFDNLSGDVEQAYFADGLAAEVRAALARNRSLQVIAQVSSDAFRKRGGDAVSIARQLGVAYLLDGNVRRSGKTFRIAAELIDGSTGFSRWSQSFDRPIDNVFAVQSEIAAAVLSALTAEVVSSGGGPPTPVAGAGAGGTSNIAAFDAYLRGRALYNRSENEATDRTALALFETAIALDPLFAAAHAARSRALIVIANQYADAEHTTAIYDDAIAAARRATQLAPDYADAQSTLAFALFQGKLDVRAAREPYELSRQLGAGDATVVGRYALYSALTARPDAAAPAIAQALVLDPLNPLVHRSAGTVLYAARRYADVAAPIQHALSLNSKLSGAHAAMGNALLQMGRAAEARSEYLLEPHDLVRLTGLAVVERKLGNATAAQAAMAKLVNELGDSALYQQAQVRAQWGELPAAEALLRRARQAGDSGLIYVRTDPLLDPLRGRPEFLQLLRALGFD